VALSAFLEQPPIALTAALAGRRSQRMLDKQAWIASVYCGGKFVGLLDLETLRRSLTLGSNAVAQTVPAAGSKERLEGA
jgi:hypothetical protein